MKYLKYDINRIIDDLILLFCFVGNDFLPRSYCFDIREGNVEKIIKAYKEYLEKAKYYLNNKGSINWK